MNKILLLFIVAAGIAGCSKNNSVSKPTTSSLTGKWIYSADTLYEYNNGSIISTTALPVNNDDYLQFNENGTGGRSSIQTTNTAKDTIVVVNYNYKLSNQAIIFDYAAYVIDGLSISAYSQTGTITQLTANKLIIFFDVSVFDNGVQVPGKEIVYMNKQ